jgi:hypothetical protein
VVAAEARGEAKAKQFASFVLFGVGGAFTVAGGTLLVLDVSGSGVKGGSESAAARERAGTRVAEFRCAAASERGFRGSWTRLRRDRSSCPR